MKRTHVMLLIIAAALPVLLLVLAMAAFLLLPVILDAVARTRPVSTVLVYEVDPPDTPVDMEAMVRAIDRRVNPGMSRQGRVQQVGDRRIEIGVYGSDPAEARQIDRIVMSVGSLEFRILANQRDHESVIARAEEQQTDAIRDDKGRRLAWWVLVSRGQERAFASMPGIVARQIDEEGAKRMEVLVVNDIFNVNGSYLTRVTAHMDQSGRPCINFRLSSRGGKLFRGLTQNNLPDELNNHYRHLGIILDGHLHSAPRVITAIGQDGQITGDFTQQEVDDLVAVLNAGSLPAGLRRVSEPKQREGAGEAANEVPD